MPGTAFEEPFYISRRVAPYICIYIMLFVMVGNIYPFEFCIRICRNNIHVKTWNVLIFNMPTPTFILHVTTCLLVSGKQRLNHIDFKLFSRQTILFLKLTNQIKIIVIIVCDWLDNRTKPKGALWIDADSILWRVLINPFAKRHVFVYCCTKHIIANIYTGRNIPIQFVNILFIVHYYSPPIVIVLINPLDVSTCS